MSTGSRTAWPRRTRSTLSTGWASRRVLSARPTTSSFSSVNVRMPTGSVVGSVVEKNASLAPGRASSLAPRIDASNAFAAAGVFAPSMSGTRIITMKRIMLMQ